jgi:hypothetical protein
VGESIVRAQPENGEAPARAPDVPAVASEADGRTSGGSAAAPARIVRSRAPRTERISQAIVGVFLAAWIALGMVLTPSPTGTGTHTVLGLPPCGMLLATGRPCPTCGVTTSFVLAAHGRPIDAFTNQPFGLVVFLGVLAALCLTVVTLATGRSWCGLLSLLNVTTTAVIIILIALISWAYKLSTM